MHHPLDVAGGLLVGVAALIVVVFACRAAGAAADDARGRTHDEGRRDRALRQDRSAAAWPSCAASLEARGQSTIRSGARCRRAARRRHRFAAPLDEGAELVFAWGGDGMVQRCIDVLAGSKARLAIIPAGTANLFATNLGIPKDIEEAVAIGLHGEHRKLDVGRFNGERFGVMAGAGFDAAMIRERRRRPEGPVRARRLRLDRLARTCARSRSAPRSRSTASAGTRARRAASCSATSVSSSAVSRRSRTRGPTTVSSNSVS